ncbi:uncharacterized protein LOC103577432 [Microplitis demolitor]|uniref:uncharacterized protein LOC103577432 n=1 Tax=Microplitis demolitor TaxID=69319 RepID=UPI0004CD8AA9|nr:uncharacterized protein LOC103577432 [Microplitis demolitor]
MVANKFSLCALLLVGLFAPAYLSPAVHSACSRFETKNPIGTTRISDINMFIPFVQEMKFQKETDAYVYPDGKDGAQLTKYFYKPCGKEAVNLSVAEVDELINFLLVRKEAGVSLLHFSVINCPSLDYPLRYELSSGIIVCQFNKN